MATHYGHVTPLRLAVEGTAAAAAAFASRRAAAPNDGGDDEINARLRLRKTRFAGDQNAPSLPSRLADVTYDELIDLR